MIKKFYTYLHCKPNGDPFYVGKGNGKRSHDFTCGRNQHHKNIVAKYGKENIGVFVFDCDSEAQALADEVQQIAQLRAEGYELCNMTDGGEGASGFKHTEETIKNLCIMRQNMPQETRDKIAHTLRGRKQSDEVKEKRNKSMLSIRNNPAICKKISIANTGKQHTTEECLKISIANRGKLKSAEHKLKLSIANLGKKHSAESKLKMSKSRKGKKRGPMSDQAKKNISAARKRYLSNI